MEVVARPSRGLVALPSSDAQLVRLIQARNKAALEIVYERHACAALGLARRIVSDHTLAEDVTQEAFISVWRNCDLYRPERGSVRAWVLGITRHRAIDALRRRATQTRLNAAQLLAEEAPSVDLTATEALRRDDTRAAQVALRALPDDQRRAIELAYYAGLTQTEIAAKLGVPLGTVKGRIRLGLGKLRELLAPAEAAA